MIWSVIIALLVFTGCQQQIQERHFTETVPQKPPVVMNMENPHGGMNMDDPHAGMNMADPHAGMDMSAMGADTTIPSQSILDWDVPQGWEIVGGHPMRLATFRLKNDPKAFECSIIMLGGEAGGVDSNLKRWLGQVGVEPSEANLDKLLKGVTALKTKDGQEAKVYDITALQDGAAGTTKSLVVGMFTLNGSTIFVKLSGSVASLKKERDHLIGLVQSLRRK